MEVRWLTLRPAFASVLATLLLVANGDAQLPTTTLSATTLGTNAATLNASLYFRTIPIAYYFEDGLTTNYGVFTPTPTVAAGSFSTNISEDINGLLPGKTYHFRAMATNSVRMYKGMDIRFSTTILTLVSSTADSGVGTLRSAVTFANTNIGAPSSHLTRRCQE